MTPASPTPGRPLPTLLLALSAWTLLPACNGSPGDGAQPMLPAGDGAATPERTTAPAAPDEDAWAEHVRRLEERLPHEGFHVVVEKPFVVIGDEDRATVERRAERTVRWACRLLEKDFFARRPAEILDVWLFKDKRSYEEHARALFGSRPTTPYGWYSPRHKALIMNISTGGGTLVHEIVHPYVAADFPACPAWFNEGLGSLFEQCNEKDGHITGLVNWRLTGLRAAIEGKRTRPFAELLATSRDGFYGAGSGLHYAQARYLLLWLQEEGKLRDYYRGFRAAAADDPTGAKTLLKLLGRDDFEAFQAEWEAWVLTLRR
ncbi:MAG: hypothetical protein R3F30_02630 [Planctomycetota bacterium]